MRSENFIAFFTVFGFFIALIFGVLKSTNSFNFIEWVVGVTLFFYLFIHLVLIFFFKVNNKIPDFFDKVEYESIANHQIKQLQDKERYIKKILRTIKQLKE